MKSLSTAAMDEINNAIADIKAHCYSKLSTDPGASVLDAGCGAGSDILYLARIAGDDGLCVGLDSDWQQLPPTQAGPAHFVAADAHTIPFPDETFDAVFSDRLLQHVNDPTQVTHELCRVLRPGGRLVVTDADHYSAIVQIADTGLAQELMRFRADQIPNGAAGKSLDVWFRNAGIAVEQLNLFKINSDNLAQAERICLWFDAWDSKFAIRSEAANSMVKRFRMELSLADESGEFLYTSDLYVLSGRKRNSIQKNS